MRFSLLWVLLLVWLVWLAAGCADNAALIQALAKDQATVCATIVGTFGTVKLARTGLRAGKVSCTADGMEVQGGP